MVWPTILRVGLLTVRCAVYTRKSSDEGLEQEFNSLDAQREACLAYIASQRHEGWAALKQQYDDGGFSGGSMERPGLQQLLLDVYAGKVDVVVIYKIDRLTRSLSDFARIMEVLEKGNASFVSVTQSFNTKNSMGRLILHVLLSFAQFEREVGAERVRDKIAASKAKGMWMGGLVPLGYDAVDRKLVVNEGEAVAVRTLFQRFVELRSVPALLAWSQHSGMQTKQRVRAGQTIGGEPFQYGALRHLLGNRTYVGEVCHRGRTYLGQHEAIVGKSLFDEVQEILAGRCPASARGPKLVLDSMLKGLLTDIHGRTMGPSHTRRSGQRYRYYTTHPKTIEANGPAPLRFAADQLERHCCSALAEHLRSSMSASIEAVAEVTRQASALEAADAAERSRILRSHVSRVTVGDGVLTLVLIDGREIKRAIAKLRHGNDARLLVGAHSDTRPPPNPQLLKLLSDAHRARALALRKPTRTLEQLATEFGRSAERFKRLIRISYLAPGIVESIMSGEEPAGLTSSRLQSLHGLPHGWKEQQAMLVG